MLNEKSRGWPPTYAASSIGFSKVQPPSNVQRNWGEWRRREHHADALSLAGGASMACPYNASAPADLKNTKLLLPGTAVDPACGGWMHVDAAILTGTSHAACSAP